MEAIGAQAAQEVELQHQAPANEPVENDPEAERQLIRAELARWHQIFYRGKYPRNVRKQKFYSVFSSIQILIIQFSLYIFLACSTTATSSARLQPRRLCCSTCASCKHNVIFFVQINEGIIKFFALFSVFK